MMIPAAATALFTYGTLMEETVMTAVTGRCFAWREGELAGYVREGVAGEVYPGIRPQAGAVTRGRIYLGVDAAALARLDVFEGELYRREWLPVRSDTGEELTAAVYVMAPEFSHRLSGRPWDPARFHAEHLAEFRRGCEAGHCRGRRRE